MATRIDIKGVIIPNDYKWFFDWLEMDATCPKDVEAKLEEAKGGDVEVYINSPGGIIVVGSEIYTALRSYKGDVKIYIVGEACSAASVIAMAGYCEMSPTALMMVHCVWTGATGNHSVMEHAAEVLRTADEALANAYMAKSGMTKEEVLDMMDHETWLTAEKAKEKGLIDGIMFENQGKLQLVASTFALPTPAQMEKARAIIAQQNKPDDGLEDFLKEHCVIAAGEKAPAALLYETYCGWCEKKGAEPISQKKFGGLLAERGFQNKRGTGGPYWWHGVGIANEANEDTEGSRSFTDNTALLRAKLNLLKLKGEER
jgi:ATP-dependent Clp protease protease subunit